MLTYLLVKGLGSAHYPVFGGSNPPVSIGSTRNGYMLERSKRSDIVLRLIKFIRRFESFYSRLGSTVNYLG